MYCCSDCSSTYAAKEKLLHHAQNEVGPEDVEEQQDHKHDVEEVIPEEGRVVVQGVDPCAVDDPETHSESVGVNHKTTRRTDPSATTLNVK